MLAYMILEDAIFEALIGRVNTFIVKGWEPLGGVQVAVVDQYYSQRFYQTMIRQDKAKAKDEAKFERQVQDI